MTDRQTGVYLALDRARDALRTASALDGSLERSPARTEILKAMAAVEAAIRITSVNQQPTRAKAAT